MYLNFWFKLHPMQYLPLNHQLCKPQYQHAVRIKPKHTPALRGPAVCSPASLSSCSSHFFPSYSFCSNSLASFLFLRCVRLSSVSRLLHLLFLGFSFPSFLHDSLICVLQVSDLLPLLRVAFLELGTSCNCSPSHLCSFPS